MEQIKLESLDVEILTYVKNNSPIKEERLITHFAKLPSLQLRIKNLTTPDSNTPFMFSIYPTTHLVREKDFLKITSLGLKALEDYEATKKKDKKSYYIDLFFKVAPLVISMLALAKSFGLL